MKAMILAAGKGTRLRPLTLHLPKPMLPIINKPIMTHILQHLKRSGVTDVVINTSYLPQTIETYFNDGSNFGINIAYSFEGHLENGHIIDRPIGSAGGMRKVQDFSGFFDDTFIVVCGDAIIDIDFKTVIDFHKANKSIATIVMKEVAAEEVYKYGVVVTDNTGKIKQFQEKPTQEEALSTTVNTGIYIFEPEIFNYIPANTEYDIGGQLFPDLVKLGLPFFGIALPYQWVDVGSVADFWSANRAALKQEIHGVVPSGHEIKPGIWCGQNVNIDWDTVDIRPPVFIGGSTFIGKNVTIVGPSIIGANSYIDSGAKLKECLLAEHTYIDGCAQLDQLMYYQNRCISADGNITLSPVDANIDWLITDYRTIRGSEVHVEIDPLAQSSACILPLSFPLAAQIKIQTMSLSYEK